MSDPAAQHEARIVTYAARVARGERLFEPTPDVTPESDRPNHRVCIGCGRAAMKGWRRGTQPPGWVVRPLVGPKKCGVEIHCPCCVKEWGMG